MTYEWKTRTTFLEIKAKDLIQNWEIETLKFQIIYLHAPKKL